VKHAYIEWIKQLHSFRMFQNGFDANTFKARATRIIHSQAEDKATLNKRSSSQRQKPSKKIWSQSH